LKYEEGGCENRLSKTKEDRDGGEFPAAGTETEKRVGKKQGGGDSE